MIVNLPFSPVGYVNIYFLYFESLLWSYEVYTHLIHVKSTLLLLRNNPLYSGNSLFVKVCYDVNMTMPTFLCYVSLAFCLFFLLSTCLSLYLKSSYYKTHQIGSYYSSDNPFNCSVYPF